MGLDLAMVVKTLPTQEGIATINLNTEHRFSLLIFVYAVHAFPTLTWMVQTQ